MTAEIIIMVIGLIGLVLGAELLVKGAMGMASNYKWPALWVGTVLIGFATTLPELIVSLIAVLKGHPHIAIGNALGSYVANIGMVLGITAMITPLLVNKKLLTREMPLLSFSVLLILVLTSDFNLSIQDGIILLIALGLFLLAISKNPDIIDSMIEPEAKNKITLKASYSFFFGGSAVLWGAGEALVKSASSIAKSIGMSDWAIGLTIVAIGTSLPELAASIISARKGQYDLAIGNVIGSNVLGLLGVVAIPSIITPGEVPKSVIFQDVGAMVIVTIALWLSAITKPGKIAKISRVEGLAMFLLFGLYILLTLK